MGVLINPDSLIQVCKGIVKKSDTTFYIQCCQAGTWHYCNDVRLAKLVKKYGSLEAVGEKYISREAKQLSKSVQNVEITVVEQKSADVPKQKVLTDEQIKAKQLANEQNNLEVTQRVKAINSYYIVRDIKRDHEPTSQEMKISDLCWNSEFYLRERSCLECIYYLDKSCGCTTKVLK